MLRFDVRPGLTEEQREALAWGDNAISEMYGLRVPRVAASQSKGMASWALRSYAQLWLHRSTELALGVCAEWNASRLLNAAVILRSFVETLAAFRAILEQGETFVGNADLKGLHQRVMKAMYGTRQGKDNHPELPDATNVLTLVDRLEKTFPRVRWYYDALCEIVHPNADGMNLFGDVNHEDLVLELHDDHSREPFAVTSLLGGIRMMAAVPVCYRMAESQLCPGVEKLELQHGPNPTMWRSA